MEEIKTNKPETQSSTQSSTAPIFEPEKRRFFKSKWVILTAILTALILVGAGATYFFLNTNRQVACTTEAKLCPDGSSVGRTGPKCEFAKCPIATPDPTANWKTYNFPEEKVAFKLPPNWNEYVVGGAGHPENPHYYSSTNPKDSDMNQETIEFGYWTMNSTYEEIVNFYKEYNAKNFPINEKIFVDGRECLLDTNLKPMGQGSLTSGQDTYLYFTDCASKNNKEYNFSFSSRNHENALLFKQILSTFKFLDQNPTPTVTPSQ